MDILNIGQGPRWRDWLAVIRRHASVGTVALVAGDSRPESTDGTHCYASLEDALRVKRPDLAILTGAAALDEAQALQVLASGMHMILDEPHTVGLAALQRLDAVARDKGLLIVLPTGGPSGSLAMSVRRLIGKVGPISHVSLIDRRPATDRSGGDVDSPYRQLLRCGLDGLSSVQALFGANPLRVMARCGGVGSGGAALGATTEAFVELENDIHIQYFGSEASNQREQTLWIEGRHGSLRCDGRWIWWRKRGWPKFAPWRLRVGATTDTRPRAADAASWSLDLVNRALSGGAAGDAARRAATRPFALLGSIVRSDQKGTIVDVASWSTAG